MSIIKKIRIKNFKSLEDVEIETNQLTFLFGPNSSGRVLLLKYDV
ncbi:MAG: AAA family ATPase [Ignavibacteria bacterium]|nr:AAA family ATPase [Ignavibacteria bacterium]